VAHILVIDLPGGNDADVLEAIIERGDEFTFLTSDLSLYRQQATIAPLLAKARHEIEVPSFDFNEILKALSAKMTLPLNAAICIVDIRMVMAAKIADHFGLAFLAPNVTMTLRDKFTVREKLAAAGIGNQHFRLARSEQEMLQAIDEIGYPVVIKPCDGYASQNIVMLHGPEDLDPLISPIPSLAEQSTDYGLGVKANQRWIVEKYLQGSFIGVDMMTHKGVHHFVGVNE
jgi:glutathione synthase/RimK-type ligase-like ATP-grasp enzyme